MFVVLRKGSKGKGVLLIFEGPEIQFGATHWENFTAHYCTILRFFKERKTKGFSSLNLGKHPSPHHTFDWGALARTAPSLPTSLNAWQERSTEMCL